MRLDSATQSMGMRRWVQGVSSVASALTNFLDSLASMNTAYRAKPFIEGATKATTDLQTMDVAYLGAPFVRYSA